MSSKKIDYRQLNASKRFCNQDVIDEVAEEELIDPALVAKVLDSQSQFTVKTIKSGGLETIIFVYLGKFKVNFKQVQKMMANGVKL